MHDVRKIVEAAHGVKPNAGSTIQAQPAVCRRAWKRLRGGVAQLLAAYRYARDVDRSVWDFAIGMDELHRAGLMSSDFRWLVCKGFVDHAREIAAPSDDARTFRRGPRLRFARTSCFVLTVSGVQFVEEMLRQASRRRRRRLLRRRQQDKTGDCSTSHSPRTLPKWDRDRQELRFGDVVVKQFKVPAANQERILAVFEEEGWPVRIDDPLPPVADQDPKARLHDTIVSLNRRQKNALIRFYGDGSAQGVRWEKVVAPTEPAAPAAANGERKPHAK